MTAIEKLATQLGIDPANLTSALGKLVPIQYWDDALPPGDRFADWGLIVANEIVGPDGTVFVRVENVLDK